MYLLSNGYIRVHFATLHKIIMFLFSNEGLAWGHNRLMSKFGLFFDFWSDLPNFWYVSYRLIGKHYFIFFSLVFSSF